MASSSTTSSGSPEPVFSAKGTLAMFRGANPHKGVQCVMQLLERQEEGRSQREVRELCSGVTKKIMEHARLSPEGFQTCSELLVALAENAAVWVKEDDPAVYGMMSLMLNDMALFYTHSDPAARGGYSSREEDDNEDAVDFATVDGEYATRVSVAGEGDPLDESELPCVILNAFGERGGFDRIIERLEHVPMEREAGEEEEEEERDVCALTALPWMLYFLSTSLPKLIPALANEYAVRFARGLRPYLLDTLSDEDIKAASRTTVTNLVDQLSRFVKVTDIDVGQEAELVMLEWSERLVRQGILEKRIAGIQMLEEVVRTATRVSSEYFQGEKPKVSPTDLADFFCSHSFIEYLYGEGIHLEVLSRCGMIPAFLASQERLTLHHLDVIWGATRGQHESIVQELYKLFPELTRHLSIEQLLHLYDMMRAAELDALTTRMISAFTTEAVARHNALKTEDTPACWYGLDLFWAAGQEGSEEAIGALCELFRSPSLHGQRTMYMEKCIENLRARRSVEPSLAALRGIMHTYPTGYGQETQSDVIQWADREHHVLDLLFEEFLTHTGPIKPRMDFLHYVLTSSPLELNVEQLRSLWQTLIVGAPSEYDLSIAFEWLSVTTHGFFSAAACEALFVELFPRLDATTLSAAAVKCFKNFFYAVNGNSGALVSRGRKDLSDVLVTRVELQGEDFLWRIAIEAQTEQSLDAINMLVSLQGRLCADLGQERAVEVRRAFVSRCLQALETSGSSRAVVALQRLLEELPEAQPQARKITVQLMPVGKNTEPQVVKLSPHTPLGHFRELISTSMHIPSDLMRLVCQGKELKPQDDAQLLSQLRVVDKSIIHVVRRPQGSTPIKSSSAPASSTFLTVVDPRAAPASLLSQPECLSRLFAAMEAAEGNPELQRALWNLVSRVPVNEEHMARLRALELDMSELFDPRSSFHLLYALRACGDLGDEWRERFYAKGGLSHLGSTLAGRDFFSGAGAPVACEALATLLELANSYVLEWAMEGETEMPRLNEARAAEFLALPALQQRALESAKHACAVSDEQHAKRMLEAALHIVVAITYQAPAMLSLDAEWLTVTLLKCTQQACRRVVRDTLLLLTRVHASLCSSMLPELLQVLPRVTEHGARCVEYFEVINGTIVVSGEPASSFSELALRLARGVIDSPVVERRNDTTIVDALLTGSMKLLSTLLRQLPAVCLEVHEELLRHVYYSCLMTTASKEDHGPLAPPKCKLPTSRSIAFELLCVVGASGPAAYRMLMGMVLEQQVALGESNSVPTALGRYKPHGERRSDCGYAGLINLGATCYMNSLTQNLFMIPEFRRDVFECDAGDAPAEKNRLYQLQLLFGHLQETESEAYRTSSFTKAFDINPGIQQDVDEYWIMLADRLETLTEGSEHEKLPQNHFGGELVNQIISNDCEHVSERTEAFIQLALDVQGKANVQESLESFIAGDLLSGDNKYHCGDCDAKVNAKKRTCLGKLPDSLVVSLKRFAFNFETFVREKVNTRFEFPELVDFFPFTREGLALKEGLPVKEEDASRPREYYQFRLSGIVVHSGTTEMGHYYAFVKERVPSVPGAPLRWISFNDSDVEEYDPARIEADCFGGADPSSRSTYAASEKRYSAYMLFYERVTVKHEDDFCVSAQASVPVAILDMVWSHNVTFLTHVKSFDVRYFEFIWELVEAQKDAAPVLRIDPAAPPDAAFKAIEVATHFLFTTYVYSKDSFNMERYVSQLVVMMRKHTPSCLRFLETLIQQDAVWLRFVFFYTTNPELTAQLLLVIKEALTVVHAHTNEGVERYLSDMELEEQDEELPTAWIDRYEGRTDPVKKSFVVARLLDTLMRRLCISRKLWRKCTMVFDIVSHVAQLGERERAFISERKYGAILLDWYMGDESACPRPEAIQNKTPYNDMNTKLETFDASRLFGAVVELLRHGCLCQDARDMLASQPLWERAFRDLYLRPSVAGDIFQAANEALEPEELHAIVTAAVSQLDDQDSLELPAALDFVRRVLLFKDDSVQWAWKHVSGCITANAKYPDCLLAVLSWCVEVAKEHTEFARCLLEGLDVWKRELVHERADVRQQVEELFVVLEPLDDGTVECEALLDLVSEHAHLMRPRATTASPISDKRWEERFCYAGALRLLHRQVGKGPEASRAIELNLDRLVPVISTVFGRSEVECDQHSFELMRLLQQVLEVTPKAISVLLEERPLRAILEGVTVILRAENPTLSFCNVFLGAYYSVVLRLVEHEVANTMFAGNSTFCWTLWHTAMLETNDYPAPEETMMKLVEQQCQTQIGRLGLLRQASKNLDVKKVRYDYGKVLRFFTQLLRGPEEGKLACEGSLDRACIVLSKGKPATPELVAVLYQMTSWTEGSDREEVGHLWHVNNRSLMLRRCLGMMTTFVRDSTTFHMVLSLIHRVSALMTPHLQLALEGLVGELERTDQMAPHQRIIKAGQVLHPSVVRYYQGVVELCKLVLPDPEEEPKDDALFNTRTIALRLCTRLLNELPREHFGLIPDFSHVISTLMSVDALRDYPCMDTQVLTLVDRVSRQPSMLASDDLAEVMNLAVPMLVPNMTEETCERFTGMVAAAMDAASEEKEQEGVTHVVCALRLAVVASGAPAIKGRLGPRIEGALARISESPAVDPMVKELLDNLRE